MTYQLMIVDDEEIIVRGLKRTVQWGDLDITEVYTANNIRQAQELLAKQQIDVLICDIEMPRGDGFELLRWVQDKSPQTKTIFLTSHAKFDYAQRAIQLGGVDYLLKPTPSDVLKEAVSKALLHIQNERRQQSFHAFYKHYHELWIQHQPILIEKFWNDLIQRNIPSQATDVMDIVRRQNLPFTPNDLFFPILVHIQHWEIELEPYDEKILHYAIRKTAEEIFHTSGYACQVIQLQPRSLLMILTDDDQYLRDRRELKEHLHVFIESCERYFYSKLSCYLGLWSPIEQVAGITDQLQQLRNNNVSKRSIVLTLTEPLQEEAQLPPPSMKVWSEMLKLGEIRNLQYTIHNYLEQWLELEGLNKQRLLDFYKQFLMMVLQSTAFKNVERHNNELDLLSPERLACATRSVYDLQIWVKDVLDILASQEEHRQKAHNLSEIIKRFIREHIDEPLSRQIIAEQVGLNPDYAGKLFKIQTGESITKFIFDERIRIAKALLADTNMQISSVALSVGYSNFSYFSNVFRKEVLMSPQEYRNELKMTETGH